MPGERVLRIDATGELEAPVRLENGWVRFTGKWGRTGLQSYTDEKGQEIIELREPEEVFAPEFLDSLRMIPVTCPHPPMLLDGRNTSTYSKGQCGQDVAKLDETWIGGTFMVTDEVTADSVQRGENQELSIGYTMVAEPTTPDRIAKWGFHHVRQTKLRGNHLALVPEARAGHDARVRLDSAGNALLASAPSQVPPAPQEGPKMPSMLRFDALGLNLEMTEGNAPAIQAAINRMVQEAVSKSDGKVAELTTKLDAAQKRATILFDNGKRAVAKLHRVKEVWDAVKAKMIPCDECDGTGKIGEGEKAAACDFCEGAGSIRMHSPIMAAKDDDSPDADDMDEELEESMDVDELEVEQATEEEAKRAHTDAAQKRRDQKRKQRKEDAKTFAAERKASIDRMVLRKLDARRALEDTARKFLPEGTDLTKLDAKGIKLAVVKALAPTAKMDGKADADVDARFTAEIERATEAGGDTTAGGGPRADAASVVPTHRSGGQKFDANWVPDPDAARAEYHSKIGKPGAAAK